MTPSTEERLFFCFCFRLVLGPAGQSGMPFFFMGVLGRFKFGWRENWVVRQQFLVPHFASMAFLYTKLIVHCPVRFSLFYCACVFSSLLSMRL